MKNILAIDPGNTHSAYAIYNPGTHALLGFDKIDNVALLKLLDTIDRSQTTLAIERLKSFGMAIGDTVLDTAMMIGRVLERWGNDETAVLIPRKVIVHTLCGSVRAGDKETRAAVIDAFGGKGEGIGTKQAPGPLYGVKADVWSAIAVALVAHRISCDRLKSLLS